MQSVFRTFSYSTLIVLFCILFSTGGISAEMPKQLLLAPDFIPNQTDWLNDTNPENGTRLGFSILRGKALKEHDGVYPVHVMQAPVNQKGDPLLIDDLIIGIDNKPLSTDPENQIQQAFKEALQTKRLIAVTRWRKGTIKTVTIDCSVFVPDLTKGDQIDFKMTWTLGSTGARGWVAHQGATTSKSRQIYITQVAPGSPAEGILNRGDVIIGTTGVPFDSDVRRAFAAAITEAEKEENGGKLNLMLWRNGAITDANLTLKVMGNFSETAPYDCKKTDRIIAMAVEALQADGLDNNSIPVDGAGIASLFNVLGLMATGRQDIMTLIKPRIEQITKEPVDGMTWGHAWTLITLTEYHLLTGDNDVLPAIERYARQTSRGQSKHGTWGHNFALIDENLPGYGAMNQLSIAHTIGLILARKCGIEDAIITKAIDKSTEFFSFYIGKGAVPYGAHEAGHEWGGDDNGKTSGCALMFNLIGHKKGADFFSKLGVSGYAGIEIGHGSNFFHLPWQGMGSAISGKKMVAAHFHECRWYYELLRDWRGKFSHHEAPGFNEEDTWWESTGARLLFFCLPRKTLYLTGKGGYIADALDDNGVERVVESGRYYKEYDKLSVDTLLIKLGDWSPIVRFRAAEALAKHKMDTFDRCLAAYKQGTIWEKYGATHYFKRLKEDAAPAVDALIENLEHQDLWLRIRSASALGEIGKPAQKAVPSLLRAVKFVDSSDTRGVFHSTLIHTLFAGNENKKTGLLYDDAYKTVSTKDVVDALKILLQNEEARSVGLLKYPLQQLSFEELQPLWPQIVYRIEHRCGLNTMFASIQEALVELLAKHKIKEGMQLAVNLLFLQRGHGGGNRAKKVIESLISYGADSEHMLIPLQLFLEKDPGFNDQLQKFKKALPSLKETPALHSITPYLGNYKIGDELERLIALQHMRDLIAKDDLAEYRNLREFYRKLLQSHPDWAEMIHAVEKEVMSIPHAVDILKAHDEIDEIKQNVIDKKISREQAIEELQKYQIRYDIRTSGPNLIYWFSKMWAGALQSGKNLKK